MKIIKSNGLLLIICLLAFHSALCQQYQFSGAKTGKQEREELGEKIKRERDYLDSLYYARKLDSLEQRYLYINTDTTSYVAFTLHIEHVPSEHRKLIEELLANGFNVSEGATAFGYGFTWKKRRFIHALDFNLIWGEEMKSDNRETVQLTGTNIGYTVGFDLLNTAKFSLFPFVTLHYQGISLEYTRKPAGQTHDNFLDIPLTANDLDLRKNALRVGFGGELDYYFPKTRRSGGIIIGLRYGLNYTAAEGNYKIEKRNAGYDPEITLRDSYLGIVLKFYERTLFKQN